MRASAVDRAPACHASREDQFGPSVAEVDCIDKDTRDALLEVKANLDSDSPLSVNINTALEELADTSRSVAELTDYLQRNPGSLVRGKYVPDKDR